MAKTKNYSKDEFDMVYQKLKSIEYNSITAIEILAEQMNRKPWSLYTFILRKFNINLLSNQDTRRKFSLIHFKANYIKGKRKLPKAPKDIVEEEPEPEWVRPPAVYSNLDINAWKDSLIADDPRFAKKKH